MNDKPGGADRGFLSVALERCRSERPQTEERGLHSKVIISCLFEKKFLERFLPAA